MLTAVVGAPQGYGRVLRQGGRVKRIVEDRDATDDEKKIAEINTSRLLLRRRAAVAGARPRSAPTTTRASTT